MDTTEYDVKRQAIATAVEFRRLAEDLPHGIKRWTLLREARHLLIFARAFDRTRELEEAEA